jgi:Peptidase A4 family
VSIVRLARPFVLAVAIPATAFLAISGQARATSGPGNDSSGQASATSFGGPAVIARTSYAEYSPNWGGYVATGTTFRYVRATFTVPRLDCAKTPGKSGAPTLVGEWVGLDSATVEQDGISGECNGHNAQYAAWYEMYPKSAAYPTMSVSGGDTIQASVWYAASKGEYELTVSDLTDNQSFTKWERCGKGSCANSSAEVITEAPGKSSGGGYYPLSDFGTTSFSSISITNAAGQHGTFATSGWLTTRFVMEDSSGHVKTEIGSLGQNGSEFQTYWERET